MCFDVGETLIDETRAWSVWADALGIPRLTFFAALGAIVATDRDYRTVFEIFGVDDWAARAPEIERAYGGFRSDDLYPDALLALAEARRVGYRVAVVANQPAVRNAQLRALGVEADVIAMSGELGVAKPDRAFYDRLLELMGGPQPADVAYVGDRVDNDVRPSRAAGMRAVWLRRGPWGLLQEDAAGDAHLVARSLAEVVRRHAELW